MSTDTLQHLTAGVWNLRYVVLFAAFLTATALGLLWRRERDAANDRVHELDLQVEIADKRHDALVDWFTTVLVAVSDRIPGTYEPLPGLTDDPVFSEGYVYDRIPAWVPADVPGATREPRPTPR